MRATADLQMVWRVYAAEHPGNVDARFGTKIEPLAAWDDIGIDINVLLFALLLVSSRA